MNKYFVIIKQKGEGCDYTIGCGITYAEFEANNELDLFNKVKEYYSYDDREIDQIYYALYSNIKRIDIWNIEREYEEYLRLKSKFE